MACCMTGVDTGTTQNNCPAECRVNFFSVFLCQGCRDIWRDCWWKVLCVTLARIWVSKSEYFKKCHATNSMRNGSFHATFTLQEGGAEV